LAKIKESQSSFKFVQINDTPDVVVEDDFGFEPADQGDATRGSANGELAF
jgi:hypothetical protein